MNYGTQYLSFDEYFKMGGSITDNAFNLLEYEVRKILDLRTLKRLVGLTTQPIEVKMCMYNLINKLIEIKENNQNISKNIKSESVGNYNVTYANTPSEIESIIKSNEKAFNDIIERDLFGLIVNNTPVIYLGV